MNTEFPNWDRIEAYLDGRLNAEEARQFEEQVARDQELAEELALVSLLHTAGSRLVEEWVDKAQKTALQIYTNPEQLPQSERARPSFGPNADREPAQQSSWEEPDADATGAWLRQIKDQLAAEGFAPAEPEASEREGAGKVRLLTDDQEGREPEARVRSMRPNWKRILLIAASIALFPVTFFLIEQYYTSHPPAPTAAHIQRAIQTTIQEEVAAARTGPSSQSYAGGQDALFAAGLEHLSTGKTDSAVVVFRDYTKTYPDEPKGHYYLGMALLKNDSSLTPERLSSAEAAFRSFLSLSPEDETWKKRANWYLTRSVELRRAMK